MGVGGDELDALEAAGDEVAKEGSPGGAVLHPEDVDTEHASAKKWALLGVEWVDRGPSHAPRRRVADEHPPPEACLPDQHEPDLDADDEPGRFDRYGFRVPLVVVSPYSKPGYVSDRFVQARFLLPALSARDADAWPLLDMFDFESPAFVDPPDLAEAVIDEAKMEECRAALPEAGISPFSTAWAIRVSASWMSSGGRGGRPGGMPRTPATGPGEAPIPRIGALGPLRTVIIRSTTATS